MTDDEVIEVPDEGITEKSMDSAKDRPKDIASTIARIASMRKTISSRKYWKPASHANWVESSISKWYKVLYLNIHIYVNRCPYKLQKLIIPVLGNICSVVVVVEIGYIHVLFFWDVKMWILQLVMTNVNVFYAFKKISSPVFDNLMIN